MATIRQLPAAEGFDWYKHGWWLFTAQPGILVLMYLVILGFSLVLGLIPHGGLILAFITPALTGGYYLAIQHVETGQAPSFEHLFKAFTDPQRRKPLFTLGLVALGAHLIMFLIDIVLIGGAIGSVVLSALTGTTTGMAAALGMLPLDLIARFIIYIALWLAMFFAIPLVMLDGMAPVDAMILSLRANLSNFLPWLVFSLILIPLTVIAIIPAGLGLLVLQPVLTAAIYRAYRQTFEHATEGRGLQMAGERE